MSPVDLVSILLNIIAPVMLVVALGFFLARVFALDGWPFSRLSLYLFSPALTFTQIYKSQLGTEFISILAFAFILCGAMGILVFFINRTMRFDRLTASAFMLSTLFVNAGNFGLPLNLFAFGQEGLSRAVVYFVATSILAQTAAIFIAARSSVPNRAALFQIFRMPLIYSVILALLFNASRWQVPEPLMKSLDLISGGTIPMILLVLGIELSHVTLSQDRLAIGLATFVRLVIGPIIAFGLAALMGLEGLTRAVCILESSTPTAVLASIFAVEFKARPEFVTSTVLVSTLVSVVSLTILLGILR